MLDFSIAGNAGREMLAFLVGSQEFCVDVMAVREIRGWTPAIALPHAQPYVRGVVNLRGAVLPIVDLALRLGFARIEPTDRHVIIVIQSGTRFVGLLVDAVSGLLDAARDAIQPAPDVASPMTRAYVEGILATDGRMISLLSLDQVLPATDLGDLAEAA